MNDIEKVIEYLKDLKYDFAYYQSGTEKRHDDYLNTAISALEKQIPKKPKIINYGTNTCHECQCDLLIWYRHCPDCGQKLDWTGVKK